MNSVTSDYVPPRKTRRPIGDLGYEADDEESQSPFFGPFQHSQLVDCSTPECNSSATDTATDRLAAGTDQASSCEKFVFLNLTYPISRANHKLLISGFFRSKKTQLAIALVKAGKQILFTSEEWNNIKNNLADLRLDSLIAKKIWSKKVELSKDLHVSITFHFGEWRVHLSKSSLCSRITLNKQEWGTFQSLIPLLSTHYSELKKEEEKIIEQINTGLQRENGSLFNRLNEELKTFYRLH